MQDTEVDREMLTDNLAGQLWGNIAHGGTHALPATFPVAVPIDLPTPMGHKLPVCVPTRMEQHSSRVGS